METRETKSLELIAVLLSGAALSAALIQIAFGDNLWGRVFPSAPVAAVQRSELMARPTATTINLPRASGGRDTSDVQASAGLVKTVPEPPSIIEVGTSVPINQSRINSIHNENVNSDAAIAANFHRDIAYCESHPLPSQPFDVAERERLAYCVTIIARLLASSNNQ